MIAEIAATPPNDVWQNLSVVASIAVSMLTIGGVLVSILFFIFKVHTATITNAKSIENAKVEQRKLDLEIEKIRADIIAVQISMAQHGMKPGGPACHTCEVGKAES